MPVLNHLTLGRYLPGESLFHRLDPRVKLGALAALVGILFLSRSLGIQLGLLVFLTLCGIGSRLQSDAAFIGWGASAVPLLVDVILDDSDLRDAAIPWLLKGTRADIDLYPASARHRAWRQETHKCQTGRR